MAVDLDKLEADLETVRQVGIRYVECVPRSAAIQNVLDALNWYRCKFLFVEQELARANAQLIEERNSSDKRMGRSYGYGV